MTQPDAVQPDAVQPDAVQPDAVLPDQTRDDTDAGWGERPEGDDVQRLLDERPPHHLDRD